MRPELLPRWLGRLFYLVRGKRRVRYHLHDGKGGFDGPTIEGLELGCWSGHYVCVLASHVAREDSTIPLQGSVEIARERVSFRQVLS